MVIASDINGFENKNLPRAGKVCLVTGCGGPTRSRGLCAKHYDRAIKEKTKKICPGCGDKMAGRSVICRKCFITQYDAELETKKCCGCGKELSMESFKFRRAGTKFKRRSRCKKCESDWAKNWRKSHPKLARERKLAAYKKYKGTQKHEVWTLRRTAKNLGLDPDVVVEHLKAHSGKCDICGNPPSVGRKRLSIDHCHKTGQFRGLLCNKCNFGIGLFKDAPELLMAAVKYLQPTGIPR